MIASVHIADVGLRRGLGVLRKAPAPKNVPGLRNAHVAATAEFDAKVIKGPPKLGRVALLAFWDDDASLDRFLDEDPMARTLADGWRLRLDPLRAHGSWPGLPEDLPRGRKVDHEGPAAVLTLARFKVPRLPDFFRTNAKAEASLLEASGLVWATAMARPPFIATCSLWESTEALSEYAYGAGNPGHTDAIAANRAKPFHHQSVFIRFRPYDSHGRLEGKHPLAEGWLGSG